MLVDINLLPEKDKERSNLFIVALIMIGVAVLIWLVLFLITQSYAKQSLNLENHIADLQENQEQVKASLQVSELLADKQSLEATVLWARDYQFNTLPLIEELVRLLPDRGFFYSFEFSGPHAASITVQFNHKNEAAYYLTRLQSNDIIREITLESVTAEEFDLEDDEAENREKRIHSLPRYLAVYTVLFNDERPGVAVDEEIPSENIERTDEGGEDND